MPVYTGSEMVEMLAVPRLWAYVADAQEEAAYGSLGGEMGVRTMTEHKWLTEKEIEQFEKEVADAGGWWKPRVKRLIADLRESRGLLRDATEWIPVNDATFKAIRRYLGIEATADKPISHELADGKLHDGISTTGQGIDYLRGRDD